MTSLLMNSLERKEKIMIYYIGTDNKITQRIIRVIQKEDTKILAYCFYRKQVRSFRIENILSCGEIKRSIGA